MITLPISIVTLFSIFIIILILLLIVIIIIINDIRIKCRRKLIKSITPFLKSLFDLLYNNSLHKNYIINLLNMKSKHNMISYDKFLNSDYHDYFENYDSYMTDNILSTVFSEILDNFETFNRYDQILTLKFLNIYLEKDKIIAEKENSKLLNKKDNQIKEMNRRINEKNDIIDEKKILIYKKDKVIDDLNKVIDDLNKVIDNKTVRIIFKYRNRLTTKYKLLFKQSLDMSRFGKLELE